jgi:hypothetical protein
VFAGYGDALTGQPLMLEQQLVHAVIEYLSTGAMTVGSAATRRWRDLVVRFENLVEAQTEGDLNMTIISAALGVPGRLLRACCANQLTMAQQCSSAHMY